MESRSSIRGQVALVAGGAEGIGGACAARFAEEGARVAVLDRNPDAGEAAAGRLNAAGGEALFVKADATSKAEVESAFGQVLGKWNRLDILVNCAGGYVDTYPIEEIKEEEWDAGIAWNLKSAMLCCQAAAAPMKRVGYGRMVSIASRAGRTGIAFTALDYSAAKAAVMGMTRRLSAELGPFGITVNAVAPGITLTPRFAGMRGSVPSEEVVRSIPLGRFANPEDIADPIWYLCTPGAGYITGVSLDINGGAFTV
ncbi:MAG: SDR family NAD(P)-dependent oxidoreductase [Nitrospinota bacterium]|jgi:3-oxoacyl-[acyl-carrier protein] reductase|nr:SDR family NAD(P)-dependent oxidoreductase [Nitrospinota bacterium]MDP7386920.1 SDR family NAD(P)-dependent oxidoreductase [Nitrospinota bacterium]